MLWFQLFLLQLSAFWNIQKVSSQKNFDFKFVNWWRLHKYTEWSYENYPHHFPGFCCNKKHALTNRQHFRCILNVSFSTPSEGRLQTLTLKWQRGVSNTSFERTQRYHFNDALFIALYFSGWYDNCLKCLNPVILELRK